MDKKTALALSSFLNDTFCLIDKDERNIIAIISSSWGSENEYDVHIVDTIAEIARITISQCDILTETELNT